MAVQIDDALVRCLVARQFPQWSELPIRAVTPFERDNRIFRLGDAMLFRLQSSEDYAEQIAEELRWLPHLAPSLLLALPTPVSLGQPAAVLSVERVRLWLAGRRGGFIRVRCQPHRVRNVPGSLPMRVAAQ